MISVIMPAHNEERYIDESLQSIVKALLYLPCEILVVVDRCSDKTGEKALKYPVKMLEKNWNCWSSSYAECLQYGLTQAKGKYVAIVDADIVVPKEFFRLALSQLHENVISVSPLVVTAPNSLWNRVTNIWQRTFTLGFFRGNYGQRVTMAKPLSQVGGFRDVYSPDTDLDMRLRKAGYNSVLAEDIKVWHIRKPSFRRTIMTQVLRGRARKQLGFGFIHTLAHAIVRLRPFYVLGWLIQCFYRNET